MAPRRPAPLGRRLAALTLLALLAAAPLAAARRPLQTGTALGKPAGEQAVIAQQLQTGTALGKPAGEQAVVAQQQQQAQAAAQQQQQQQQTGTVDQLEGEQPQVQLTTQQPVGEQQKQQQEQQMQTQQTQQQQPTTAQQQADQQPQQPQGQQPQGVDEMFLCQDKLANATIVEQLPQLKIEQVLNSNKPRSPQDVTLVTQLSFERLYMLEGQCDVWNGVISAAVYIALLNGKAVTVELNSNQDPRLTDMAEVEAKFKQFHQLAEAKGLCKLDLMLVSQTVESVWLSALYPVNAMRNRALANAHTDAVLLLDVDFWPSAELSELMQKPAKYASLMSTLDNGTAIVLPAYETGDAGDIGVEVAREAVLEGKDAAVKMFWDGRIKAFHTDRYEAGHRATNYKRWLEAARPYPIQYEEGYEPYVIIHRRYVPWYDERFVGYRKNKVVHLLYLSSSGIQWVVHPRAFAVHSPHPRARTWKVTHKTGLWDQLAEIYDQAKEGMFKGTYLPVSMYSCGEHTAGPLMRQRPTFLSATA